MTKKVLFLLWFTTSFCFSQNDTIVKTNKLEEVVVIGRKNQKQEVLGVKSMDLTTEQLVKNPTNLTNLLRYTSPIVFRDYGYGGVSTARFRGTSATNTLVLWNGIPINAVGSGQTDFNSISANISDNINIQSGGGSVEYGSGAIGGTINLKDNLDFNPHQDFHLFTSYGSFKTTSNFFKTNIGDGKWAVKLASTYNSSENNYTYIDDRYSDSNGDLYTNLNGNYENYGITFALGYQFSKKNTLSFYSTGYYGERFFSSGLPNPLSGSERYKDLNQRNLLKWNYDFGKFKQLINASYASQEFNYYANKDIEDYNYGKSNNYRLSYNLKYKASPKLSFKTIIVGDLTEGESSSIVSEAEVITNNIRRSLAFVGGFSYKPIQNLSTTLNVRKELNNDFEVPLAFSFSATQRLNNFIKLKGVLSSNYRIPTFNELYWPVVGNLSLVPEEALQGELGLLINYKNLNFQLSGFYIHTDHKIIWTPTGGSNLWRPNNINSVVNKGIEGFVNYKKVFGKSVINASLNYMYTIAKDLESGSYLPYVPMHASNLNLEFNSGVFKVYTQTLFQSKVYTNLINIDFFSLEKVFVNNMGVDFNVFNKANNKVTVGGKVNNVFNKLYYFSNLRPMPERNFNININYKF